MRNLVICWGGPSDRIIDFDCSFTSRSISIPVCSIGRGISTQPTEHRRDPWVRPSISSGISTLLGPMDQVSVGDNWQIVRVDCFYTFPTKGRGAACMRESEKCRGVFPPHSLDVLWGISSVHIILICPYIDVCMDAPELSLPI